jgi:hypothetical protein
MLEFGLLSLLVLWGLLRLRARASYTLLSPIYALITFNMASLLASLTYYFFVQDKVSLFGVDDVRDVDIIWRTASEFAAALLAFIAGVLMAASLSRGMVLEKILPRYTFSSQSFGGNIQKGKLILAVIIGCGILIGLMFAIYGRGYFDRASYLPDGKTIERILQVLVSIALVILIGLLFRTNKKLAGSFMGIFLLLNIPTGSRRIVVYGLVYLVMTYPYWSERWRKAKILGYVASLALLFAYVIQLRSLESHGLFPYLQHLQVGASEIVEQMRFIFYYVFVYGFFVAIQTKQAHVVNWVSIGTSLSPLPGIYVGWYDLADTLRLNRYAPFSTYGEIFSMGYGLIVVYHICLGAAFYYLEVWIRRWVNRRKTIRAYGILFLAILYVFYAYEYNLRSSTRLVYYALFFVIVLKLAASLRATMRTRVDNGGSGNTGSSGLPGTAAEVIVK